MKRTTELTEKICFLHQREPIRASVVQPYPFADDAAVSARPAAVSARGRMRAQAHEYERQSAPGAFESSGRSLAGRMALSSFLQMLARARVGLSLLMYIKMRFVRPVTVGLGRKKAAHPYRRTTR